MLFNALPSGDKQRFGQPLQTNKVIFRKLCHQQSVKFIPSWTPYQWFEQFQILLHVVQLVTHTGMCVEVCILWPYQRVVSTMESGLCLCTDDLWKAAGGQKDSVWPQWSSMSSAQTPTVSTPGSKAHCRRIPGLTDDMWYVFLLKLLSLNSILTMTVGQEFLDWTKITNQTYSIWKLLQNRLWVESYSQCYWLWKKTKVHAQ